MWVDKRGHWHYIMHRMFDPGPDACGAWSGGHSFSADGTSWSPIRRAYNTTVALEGGGSFTFQRRERPKLLIEDGVPTYLYNAAITPNQTDIFTIGVPLDV